jgi:DNA primase
MKKQGWDFQEALKYLAEKAGVQLKPPTPQELVAEEEHAQLRTLLEEAANWYHQQLRHTSEGQKALVYLNGRGVSDEIINTFGLGYAPNTRDAIIQYFKAKGRSDSSLKEAGLVSERDDGSIYDKFRHRIIFPIRDGRNRMAGFGGRVLNPDDIPKFLNSPQTPVFDKSALLYGLEHARTPIRALDQAVIVEGYLDVIALHQAGFTNTVSPMGTALTEQQLRLLKRLTQRIILALDPDAAGDKATLRGLQIARQTMDRESEPVFDARGLLAHETRLQADIRVTTLPAGMDPDDVVKADPGECIHWKCQTSGDHGWKLATGRDVDDQTSRLPTRCCF